MKVIIFGATGYVGSRLTAELLKNNHHVICFARTPKKLDFLQKLGNLELLQGDLFDPESLQTLPKDVDIAYYLVHSLSETDFEKKEKIAGENFLHYAESTSAKQIIFLSGIINDKALSPHLRSRKRIEELLQSSSIPSTILRAGIIIGNESASFIILRDLTEKLPFMVAPKWIENRLKPISIYDTVFYLQAVAGDQKAYNQIFDIASDDELSYKELLFLYAKVRNLQRIILTIPVLTPRLSSYWLIFITSQDFHLARSLVDSLKNNFLPDNEKIKSYYPHALLSCEEAINQSMAPLDKEAAFFFSQEGKLPQELYSYQFSSSDRVPSPKWTDLFENKIKKIKYRQNVLGEYWMEEEEGSLRLSYRPKGALGRVVWLLLYPIRRFILLKQE